MKQGSSRHELLEKEDHDVVDVEVSLAEDALGFKFLNSLNLLEQLVKKGSARELWICAFYRGILIRGIIDDIRVKLSGESDSKQGGYETFIADTKTRSTFMEPSSAQKQTSAIQLQLYRWMLGELQKQAVAFLAVVELYECDPDKAFDREELKKYGDLRKLSSILALAFSSIPPVSTTLEITYECDSKVFSRCRFPYDELSLKYTLNELLDWWFGTREPWGVLISEKWKCKWCDFLEICSVCPLEKDVKKNILQNREEKKKSERSKEQCDSCVTLEKKKELNLAVLDPSSNLSPLLSDDLESSLIFSLDDITDEA